MFAEANELDAAGREDAREHAAACYHQLPRPLSLREARLLPVGSPRPHARARRAPAQGPSTSDASAVARVLLSEWPYWGPQGSPGWPQPSSAVRLLFGTFSGLLRRLSAAPGAPSLPARFWAPVILYPPANRLSFTSVPVAWSPWNCPPNPPSSSLVLSLFLPLTHTQSFDAPWMHQTGCSHTDPHRSSIR